MSRVIKFRAFWKDTIKPIEYFNEEYYISALNLNIFIVDQYTGLTDKNGVEIYENDILRTESFLTRIIDNTRVEGSDHTNYYIIEYNSEKDRNGWQLRTIKTTRKDNFGLGYTSHSFLYTYTDKCEIIGNLHQNSDLLK